MTGLTCAGPYDWKVLYCRRRELDYTCDHSNDVGVRCIGKCLRFECVCGFQKSVLHLYCEQMRFAAYSFISSADSVQTVY